MQTITIKLVVDGDDVDTVNKQVEEFMGVVCQPVFEWSVKDSTKKETVFAFRERDPNNR